MRRVVGAIGLAAAMLAAGPPARAAEHLKMTIPVLSASFAPYLIAQEKGYYADEGLDVERVMAQGGVATAALLSGSVGVSTSSSSALSAILRGAPFKIVYTMMDRPDYQLWSTQPELKTLRDLKGKNVGIQTRGDTYEIAMRLSLRAAGLPGDWVGYTALGFGPGERAAFKSGSLPAVMIAKEDLDQIGDTPALKRGHLIVNTYDSIRMPYTGAVVSDKFLKAKPQEVEHFLRATLKGMRYMRTFRAGTNAMLKKAGSKLDDRTLDLDYTDVVKTLTKEGTAPVATLRRDMETRAEILKIPAGKLRPVDAVYDYHLLHQANAELDKEGWKPMQ